jgi:hypothetical protein
MFKKGIFFIQMELDNISLCLDGILADWESRSFTECLLCHSVGVMNAQCTADSTGLLWAQV